MLSDSINSDENVLLKCKWAHLIYDIYEEVILFEKIS